MAVTTDAEFLMKIKAKDEASKQLGGITSMAQGMVEALGTASAAIITLNQGLELAKKAWAALSGPIMTAVDAYAEAEKMERRLINAMKLSGQYTAARLDSFKDFATQLQRTTMMEDDSVLGMLATAKAMGMTDDMAKLLVKSSGDLAAAMGISVADAFAQMQGTMVGMTKGVAKAVPDVRLLTQEQLKMGKGIELVAQRLAGSSEEMVRSWEGMTAQLKNYTGDVFEEIGKIITESLTMPGGANLLIDTMVSLKEAIAAAKEPILDFRDTLVGSFAGMVAATKELNIAFVALAAAALAASLAMTTGAWAALGGLLTSVIPKVWSLVAAYGAASAAAALAALKVGLVATGILATAWAVELLIRNVGNLKALFVAMFSYVLGGLNIIAESLARMAGMDKFADSIAAKTEALGMAAAEAGESLDTGFGGQAIDSVQKFFNVFSTSSEQTEEAMKRTREATEGAGDAARHYANQLQPLNDANRKALDDMIKRTEELQRKAQERGLSEIQLAQMEQVRAEKSASTLAAAIEAQRAMTPEIRKQIAAYMEAQKADSTARIAEAQKQALEEATKVARGYQDEMAKIGLEQEELIDQQLAQDLRDIDALRQKLALQGALTKEVEAQLSAAAGAAQGRASAKREEISFDQRSLVYAAKQFSASFGAAAASVGAGIFDGQKWMEAGKSFMGMVAVGFSKIAPYIGMALMAGAEAIRGIFSGEYLNTLASFAKGMGDFPDTLMRAFENLADTLVRAIDKLPVVVEKLLSKLPELVDKIVAAIPQLAQAFAAMLPKLTRSIAAALPKIAEAIAKAAPVIMQAIGKAAPVIVSAMMKGITELIKRVPQMVIPLLRAIPEIVTAVMDGLPDMVTALFDALPTIFQEIFRIVPAIIENLLENIDEVVYAFVEGFIGSMGEIVASFIDEMLFRGGIERIMGAILRAIPRIALALVKGIINGLARALKAFGFKGFKLPAEITQLPEKIANGAKKLGDRIAKDASQLFKVAELTQAARAMDAADRIRAALESATAEAVEAITSVWEMLRDAVRRAFQWVIDNVWVPLVSWVQRAWAAVIAFFQTLGSWIAAAWQAVYTFFQNLGGSISKAWKTVFDFFKLDTFYNLGNQLWLGLKDGLANGLEWLKTTLANAGKSIWYSLGGAEVWKYVTTNLTNAGKSLFYALGSVWDWLTTNLTNVGKSIWYSLVDVWDWLWDNLKKLGGAVWGGGGGGGGLVSGTGTPLDELALGGWVKAANSYLANGGPVYAQQGMFVPKGTDTVPIMGTPGEFMVNRASAQANAGLLTAINNGRGEKFSMGGGPVSINVVINAKTNMTPDQIRTEVVPVLERAIKRKSLEGGFVLAASGVRA